MNKYRITYPNNKEVREYKSRTTKTKVIGAYMFTNYDYGWQKAQFFINQGAYYNQWDMLFELARKIR